jgi:hypothetical protein
MAGRTTSLYTRIYVDSADGTVRNITGSVNSIGGLGVTADQIDVSTFADSMKQYLNGLKDSALTMSGPFNDTALAVSPAESGAHKVLAPLGGTNTATTVTIEIGSRAEPTSGDAKWSGEYLCDYQVQGDLGSLTWNAAYRPAFGTSTPTWSTK